MSTMATMVDELLIDDIVDSPDVARVTGTTARSVSRWLEGASPRRPAEERLLELKSVLDLLRRVLREEPARLWIHLDFFHVEQLPVPDPWSFAAASPWEDVTAAL